MEDGVVLDAYLTCVQAERIKSDQIKSSNNQINI
jgi:hypothetical protein